MGRRATASLFGGVNLRRYPVMTTQARGAFDTNIQRAGYFLDIHEATQAGRGAPELPRRELPRAGLVFAVGAIDAYLSDVSAEVIVAQLQQRPANSYDRDVLRKIQQDVPTLSLEVALLEDGAARLDRIRAVILEHFYANVTAIGSRAVAAAVQRMDRKPADLWNAIAGRGYENPAHYVDQAADMRHRIVHRGERVPISRDNARWYVGLAARVVHQIDAYAENAIRNANEG